MLLKKILSLVAGGLLFVGCSKNPYEFNGMIGGVHIKSGITLADRTTFMEISDSDGSVTKCFDYNWDLKLDCVEVLRNGETRAYHSSLFLSSPQVEKMQLKFDSYRKEIGK